MINIKGLTILELMISLLLGIFIVLFSGTLYLKHKKLYVLVNDQVEYSESRRFIHSFLTDQINRAGFHNSFFERPDKLFPFESKNLFLKEQVVALLDKSDLIIRYQPMYPNQLSCDGRNIAKNIKSSDEIKKLPNVKTRIHFDKKSNILRCNGHAILEGVESVSFYLVEAKIYKGLYVKAINYEVMLSNSKVQPIKGTVYLRNTEWLASK